MDAMPLALCSSCTAMLLAVRCVRAVIDSPSCSLTVEGPNFLGSDAAQTSGLLPGAPVHRCTRRVVTRTPCQSQCCDMLARTMPDLVVVAEHDLSDAAVAISDVGLHPMQTL